MSALERSRASTNDVTRLAQSDPLPNLNNQWVTAVVNARVHLRDLTRALRELDKTAETLLEHDITVSVDLGPIGNAAAAARRDLEKKTDTPTFKMPTASNPANRERG